MSKSQKSSVARRRLQLRKRQERQNQLIRWTASGFAVVALFIIAYIIWQALQSEEEVSEGMSSETLLSGDRPLATVPPAQRNGYYSSYPEMIIEAGKSFEAVIDTDKGEVRISLFADRAPLTVNNFVFLATEGFYDGTTFHRVIDDFMAQGGDPAGSGTGGPGYRFEDETDNGLVFDRPGILAMANSGPNTNGSQFFITFVPTSWLNGNHTIFGEVIEGSEVLSQLTRRQPGAATPGDVINRIDIIEVEP